MNIIHSLLDMVGFRNVTLASVICLLLRKGVNWFIIVYNNTHRDQTFAGTAWNRGSVNTSGGQ